MAVAAVINVIGVLSGILGIAQFGIDNFGASDTGGSVVRFQVGLNSDGGLDNAGGDIPDIRLFNEVGEFLGGSYDPGFIEDGTTGSDIRVTQKSEQQATYALFSANDDAVCLAYISIVWPDEQKYGWLGSWGRQCGASWYYSNIVIDGQKPECMWIDKNKDQPVTGFQVHFPEFVQSTKDGPPIHDAAYYCNNKPAFGLYYDEDPKTITYWTQPAKKLTSRSKLSSRMTADTSSTPSSSKDPLQPINKRRGEIVYSNDKRLVLSSDTQHNAADLCSSPHSLGPDFVNTATGHFCKMSDKTLHPICSPPTVTDNCFNVDTHKLVIGGVSLRDQAYSKVIDWSGTPPHSN